LVYSTYFGGSGADFGKSIAVDSTGSIYFTGFTQSSDFPITPGAFQETIAGQAQIGFITKLNPEGFCLCF